MDIFQKISQKIRLLHDNAQEDADPTAEAHAQEELQNLLDDLKAGKSHRLSVPTLPQDKPETGSLKQLHEKQKDIRKKMRKIQSLKTAPLDLDDTKALRSTMRQLQSALSDPEVVAEDFRKARWKHGVHCPACQSHDIKRHGAYGRNPFYFSYMCLECGENFHDFTGTGLSPYVRAIHRWMQSWHYSEMGIPQEEISQFMGIDLEVLGHMAELLAFAMPVETFENSLNPESRASTRANTLKEESRIERRKKMPVPS